MTSVRNTAFGKAGRSAALSIVLVSAALTLSACAPTGKAAMLSAVIRQPKNPAHGVMAQSAEPKTAPVAASETPAKPTAENLAAAAPAASAKPVMIWRSADKLMGLAADELQAALGAPARIRDEESGRIYQYVGADCVLDLFLYQGVEGSYRVSYAEARSIHAFKKPVDACLKSLPAPIIADNAPAS